MHLITLRFGPDRSRAPELMADHVAWLQKGFDEGSFLASGSLPDGVGGFILARGDGLEERVATDPFVAQSVVTAELQPLKASRMAPGLAALVGA